MQTFLPYPDFLKSVQCLDSKRLGKQRIEALQILNILSNKFTKSGKPHKGYINHPIVIMWKGYEDALKLYYNLCLKEWILRGYKNTMKFESLSNDIHYPLWIGNKFFHSSHRSNLLRKNYNFYSKYNWKENINNPYVWINSNNELYTKVNKIITILK